MKRALLVSNSDHGSAALVELLKAEGWQKVTAEVSAYGARQAVENDNENEYDLICINAPLPDESGVELAEELAQSSSASVVIIIPKSNADEINDLLTPRGVMVISKPINRHLFHHYLQFSDCFRARLLKIESENKKLRTMVEDIKLINRAKLLLVSCLNISEEQAHR